jgi:hypothetical protein
VPEYGDRLTEAEYPAWVQHRARQMAEKATAALPDWAREAGMRIEWAGSGDDRSG